MGIRIVLLDVGDVVVEAPNRKISKEMARYSPYGADRIRRVLFESKTYRDSEMNKVSSREYFAYVKGKLKLRLSFDEFVRVWRRGSKRSYGLLPGMAGLIRSLERVYKVYFMTNLGPLHGAYQYADVPYLRKTRSRSFLSYKLGMRKPSPKLFTYLARKLKVRPEEVVFVDDKRSNCAGARKAGMRAIHFKGATQLKRELKRLGVKV